uniref:protein-tyrosine-phosphatase n=1 Tax=Chelonoidis abingdonii TaxID=106734 RepID=A0A8C0GUP4_CHEAB
MSPSWSALPMVMDCIYLGNLNAAYCGRVLCRNNIDSIIDMSSLPSNCSLSVDIQGPLNEKCPALREPCFWDINECIAASLEKRKRVLIHCLDGYSLAPTCVIQYLMVKHNMRLMAAYEFVRARYPLNIRECHQDMLVGLERSLQPGDMDMERLNSSPQLVATKVSRMLIAISVINSTFTRPILSTE